MLEYFFLVEAPLAQAMTHRAISVKMETITRELYAIDHMLNKQRKRLMGGGGGERMKDVCWQEKERDEPHFVPSRCFIQNIGGKKHVANKLLKATLSG